MTMSRVKSSAQSEDAAATKVMITEAQLRWAQFQYRKNVPSVQAKIERLYLEGEADGGQTASSRRARLEVSLREHERRREDILQGGYRWTCDDSPDDTPKGSPNDTPNENATDSPRESLDGQEDDDVLAVIFAETQESFARSPRQPHGSTSGSTSRSPSAVHPRRNDRKDQRSGKDHSDHSERVTVSDSSCHADRTARTDSKPQSTADPSSSPIAAPVTLLPAFETPQARTTISARSSRRWTRPDGVESCFVVDEVTDALLHNTKTSRRGSSCTLHEPHEPFHSLQSLPSLHSHQSQSLQSHQPQQSHYFLGLRRNTVLFLPATNYYTEAMSQQLQLQSAHQSHQTPHRPTHQSTHHPHSVLPPSTTQQHQSLLTLQEYQAGFVKHFVAQLESQMNHSRTAQQIDHHQLSEAKRYPSNDLVEAGWVNTIREYIEQQLETHQERIETLQRLRQQRQSHFQHQRQSHLQRQHRNQLHQPQQPQNNTSAQHQIDNTSHQPSWLAYMEEQNEIDTLAHKDLEDHEQDVLLLLQYLKNHADNLLLRQTGHHADKSLDDGTIDVATLEELVRHFSTLPLGTKRMILCNQLPSQTSLPPPQSPLSSPHSQPSQPSQPLTKPVDNLLLSRNQENIALQPTHRKSKRGQRAVLAHHHSAVDPGQSSTLPNSTNVRLLKNMLVWNNNSNNHLDVSEVPDTAPSVDTCSTSSHHSSNIKAYAAFRRGQQDRRTTISKGEENVDTSGKGISSQIVTTSTSASTSTSSSSFLARMSIPGRVRNVMNNLRGGHRNPFSQSTQSVHQHHEFQHLHQHNHTTFDYDSLRFHNQNHDGEHKQFHLYNDSSLFEDHEFDDDYDQYNQNDQYENDDPFPSHMPNLNSIIKRIEADFSPERVRSLVGGLNDAARERRYGQQSIIDTDANSSIATSEGEGGSGIRPPSAMMIQNLLLSPTILTKRHQQAIRSIENRLWEQVAYLINANPWLAEMTDINTGMYLLHKLAFYGAGQVELPSSTPNGSLLSPSMYDTYCSTNASDFPIFRYPPAPNELNLELLRLFPAAVHKFDHDGNVPLHWAASSANLSMLNLLGTTFREGASVRNYSGMLPLHLSVLSCAITPLAAVFQHPKTTATSIVETVLSYFPGGVAVADNEGNLPLHLAASVLRGKVGVDIIHCLLQAEQKLISAALILSPFSSNLDQDVIETLTRTHSNTHKHQRHHQYQPKTRQNDTSATHRVQAERNFFSTTSYPDDTNDDTKNHRQYVKNTSSTSVSSMVCCLFTENERGDTPLAAAIRSKSDLQIIDILASASTTESHRNGNIKRYREVMSKVLLLLVQDPTSDPSIVLAILNACPEATALRNEEEILPIEFACMQMFPREIIFTMATLDLPIVLSGSEGVVRVNKGFGGSWWFLTCDCDDYYVDIVEDILALCTFAQVRMMCCMKRIKHDESYMLLSRATPKCRDALQRSMRFLGRYEFVGTQSNFYESLATDQYPKKSTSSVHVVNALDFGPKHCPIPLGKSVYLVSYSQYETFIEESKLMRVYDVNFEYVERIEMFSVEVKSGITIFSPFPSSDAKALQDHQQYCISIEQPTLTLTGVVQGMLDNDSCRMETDTRARYSVKVFSVLRVIAKALRYLHSIGLVHCNVNFDNCAKYGDSWKLANFLGCKPFGEPIKFYPVSDQVEKPMYMFGKLTYSSWKSAPPESFVNMTSSLSNNDGESTHSNHVDNDNDIIVQLRSNVVASPAFDSWSFGKVAYEVLTGKSLLEGKPLYNDSVLRLTNRSSGSDCQNVDEGDLNRHMGKLVAWTKQYSHQQHQQHPLHRLSNYTSDTFLESLKEDLSSVKVPPSGIELIVQCLSPLPDNRPSMDEVLLHNVWLDLKRTKEETL